MSKPTPTIADDLQWLWEDATPRTPEWEVRYQRIVTALAEVRGEPSPSEKASERIAEYLCKCFEPDPTQQYRYLSEIAREEWRSTARAVLRLSSPGPEQERP